MYIFFFDLTCFQKHYYYFINSFCKLRLLSPFQYCKTNNGFCAFHKPSVGCNKVFSKKSKKKKRTKSNIHVVKATAAQQHYQWTNVEIEFVVANQIKCAKGKSDTN